MYALTTEGCCLQVYRVQSTISAGRQRLADLDNGLQGAATPSGTDGYQILVVLKIYIEVTSVVGYNLLGYLFNIISSLLYYPHLRVSFCPLQISVCFVDYRFRFVEYTKPNHGLRSIRRATHKVRFSKCNH